MEQSAGDLESRGETFILDSFALKPPPDAVQWLLEQTSDPPKTHGDEAPPALKFFSAFSKSSYKRKQAIIVHLVKGFEALEAFQRVTITILTMRVMEAMSALKLKTGQNQQEKSQPEQNRPMTEIADLKQMPDLKQLIELIKAGALDTQTLVDMLKSVPAERRASVIESVKAAAVQQGLGEEDIAFLAEAAGQTPQQDVPETRTPDPESEAPRSSPRSWSKLSLMLKMAEELKAVPADERPYLAQAAKVAVLQTGVLKVIKSIIELITELKYKDKKSSDGLDQRKQLESIITTNMLTPRKDDLSIFFVHRAIAPGGYADQLLSFTTALLFAYEYAWALAALPVIELLISMRRLHCAVPLFAWLRADAVLWLISAGTSFRLYIEYCYIYGKYQAIEEAKLAAGKDAESPGDETERDQASSDLEVIQSLIDRTTLWKFGLIGGLCLLSLVAGWAAMVVATIEILVGMFKNCGFGGIFIALIFDILRIITLVFLVSVAMKLYQEFDAIPKKENDGSRDEPGRPVVPKKESDQSYAGNYGSFEDADKSSVPVFSGRVP